MGVFDCTKFGLTSRDHGSAPLVPNQVERQRVADLGGSKQVLTTPQVAIEPPADPACRGKPSGHSRQPLGHRVEVTEIRIGVADTFDNGELTGIPETLELCQLRVETRLTIQRKRVSSRNRQSSMLRVVVAVGNRDDGIETIVAAKHPDHDQDSVVGS